MGSGVSDECLAWVLLQGNILYKLNFPLLENANEYIVHGFTHNVRITAPDAYSCTRLPDHLCDPTHSHGWLRHSGLTGLLWAKPMHTGGMRQAMTGLDA